MSAPDHAFELTEPMRDYLAAFDRMLAAQVSGDRVRRGRARSAMRRQLLMMCWDAGVDPQPVLGAAKQSHGRGVQSIRRAA